MMRVNRSTARTLAWAAIAAQLVFVLSWIVAGALEEGYSHLEQGVSELGADNAENPLIVNAGIIVLGLSWVALGLSLLPVLPRRPARIVAVALFAAAGVAIALAGASPVDCWLAVDETCENRFEEGELSWQTYVHVWSGFAAEILFLLTPFALWRALWPSSTGAAAFFSGSFGVVFFLVAGFGLGMSEDVAHGLVQRVGWLVIHTWVLIVAGGVIWETRRQREPGPLVPLRPREFLSSAFRGEGEIVMWPWFIGRRFATRFTAQRTATWISDRLWRFDDEARFGERPVFTRKMYCEIVSDDHVRLTAGDLPDGADIWLEEGGYRITPFRMHWPVGPVPVTIRVRDISYVRPDGVFVNVNEARTPVFGLPLAQMRFYVRPDDREPAPERAKEAVGAADNRG
jgi:hypothetical protein